MSETGPSRWRWLVLAIILALVTLVSSVDNAQLGHHRYSVDTSPINQDTWCTAIAHGYNIDAWIEDGHRRPSYWHLTHPGIGFQLSSWLTFRLASSAPDAVARVKDICAAPSQFVRLNQAFALALQLLAMSILFSVASPRGVVFASGACLASFVSKDWYHWGLHAVSNETFALLLALALFGYARFLFARRDQAVWPWCGLGLLGGLCYLVKLPYLTWYLGVLVGACVLARQQRYTASAFFRRLAGLLSGTGLALAGGAAFLGTAGLGSTFEFHWLVATSKGLIGSGGRGLTPLSTIGTNLVKLWLGARPFSLYFLLLIGLSLFRLVQWRRQQSDGESSLPLFVSLAVATALASAALLKHFTFHYVPIVASLLPLLYLSLGWSLSTRGRQSLGFVTLLAVCLSNVSFWHSRQWIPSRLDYIDRVHRSSVTLAGPDHKMLWTFRSFGADALLPRVSIMAGEPRNINELMGAGHYYQSPTKYLWAQGGPYTYAEAAWSHVVQGFSFDSGYEEHLHSFLGKGRRWNLYSFYPRSGWRPLRDPTEWKFTQSPPPADWNRSLAASSDWSSGRPGFSLGTTQTPPARLPLPRIYRLHSYRQKDFNAPFHRLVRTPLEGSQIWACRPFALEQGQRAGFVLAVNHDGEFEVFLNGVSAGRSSTSTGDRFVLLEPSPKALEALNLGENLIAVRSKGQGYLQVIPAQRLP